MHLDNICNSQEILDNTTKLESLKLIELLSNASGPSGYEHDVKEIIINIIKNYVDEVFIDNIGNIIAHKRGAGPKVLVDAHMDEVGLIITGYNNDGSLRFASLGGLNRKILPSKVVYVGKNSIPGVIGSKPILIQNKNELNSDVSYKDAFIDIGLDSREKTEKVVELGDYVVFSTEFDSFGDNLIKGKAFDNRLGCALLVELLKEKYNCDLYASFSVQEEIGERGAFVSAYYVKPDIGIVLEGTICSDFPDVSEYNAVTSINSGPAISIMDEGSFYNYDIINELTNIAKMNGIQYQFRRSTLGVNDAIALNISGQCRKVVTVSVPSRYIHSFISVASIEDYNNSLKLLIKFIKTI